MIKMKTLLRAIIGGREDVSRTGRGNGSNTAAILVGVCLCMCLYLWGYGLGGHGKDFEERKAIVDDYKGIILARDQDNARFDQALLVLEQYVEDPGAEKKEEASAAFWEIADQMEAESQGFVPYQVSEDMEKLLTNQGISVVEYESAADLRYTELEDHIQSLTFLGFYLEVSDMDQMAMEDLAAAVERYQAYQKVQRAYCYTEINYWFAPWGEKEREYLEEQILGQLQSFEAENGTWEHDRNAVEEKLNGYLDELEGLVDELAEFVGESSERLYEMME